MPYVELHVGILTLEVMVSLALCKVGKQAGLYLF